MTRNGKVVKAFGEKVTIDWTGSVWVSPSNGQQHANPKDAMRVELRDVFRSSGDDLDDPKVKAQIEKYLETMVDVG